MTLLAYLLGLVLLLTHMGYVRASDEKPLRWDTSIFGVKVEKPEKGRRWIVASTISGTEAGAMKQGDEIWEIDDKQVTIDDDVPAMLRNAGDSVKIRAKRVVVGSGRPKTITDERTFRRTTYWELVTNRFDRELDPLTKIEKWTHKLGTDEVKSPQTTAFIPILVMKDEAPVQVAIRFQFVSSKWLFVRKITFRHGDRQWNIEKDRMSTEVRSDGILEWFTDGEDWAKEVFDEVGKNMNSESLIRLDGRDYYHDHKLSSNERIMFSDMYVLRELAHQRSQDLPKK